MLVLEDRVVPYALGPGGYWDDGHWENGVKVGVTVTVHSYGPGWLEVGGGGGTAYIAPGTPPPSNYSYSGYSGTSNPPPNPPNYSVDIGGNANWSGSGDTLGISASGWIGSLNFGGNVYAKAGESVGNVSGRDVSVYAGTSVGNVNASSDIWNVSSGKSVGSVDAGDDIFTVYAGTNVGDTSAGGDIWILGAGKSTGSVEAGGDIGTVSAGEDIGGSVNAGGNIGGISNPSGKWENWGYGQSGAGVSAGRNIAKSVTAGSNISSVHAGGQIGSSVKAGVDIFLVTSGGGYPYSDSMLDMDPNNSPPTQPYLGFIAGPVEAGRDVRVVNSTGDIAGAIQAGRSIVAVNAANNIAGAVTAGLDVGKAPTPDSKWTWLPSSPGGWSWWGWSDYSMLGSGVHSRDKSVSGAVSAAAGEVTSVTAAEFVSGAIKANTDIGYVSARDKDVSGTVKAGDDISWVSAGRHVSGNIDAGNDINVVSAGGYGYGYEEYMTIGGGSGGLGDITGNVTVGGGIGWVNATGNVSGNVSAKDSVGRTDSSDPHLAKYHPFNGFNNPYSGGVQAGQSVTGMVDAGSDVSMVVAGKSVSGGITAGRDIGFVHGVTGVSSSVSASRDVGNVYAGGYGWLVYGWGQLVGGSIASVSGDVTATGDVYGVRATGNVAGTITAGGGIGNVEANDSVTGDVTAGDSIGYVGPLYDPENPEGEGSGYMWYGGIGVRAGNAVDSAIDAGGDVTGVQAGDGIFGSVTAGRDIGQVRAGADIEATVDAGRDIGSLSAGTLPGYPVAEHPGVIGSILGDATASRDIRTVTATGNINASITAGHAIGGIYAIQSIAGAIEATTGSIGRLTDEPEPSPGNYSAYFFPYSGYSNAPVGVHAGESIDATIIAGIDITWVDAGDNIAGSIDAGRDIDRVQSTHSISATVDAGRDLDVVKAGDALPGYTDPDTGDWVEPDAIIGSITGDLSAGEDIGTVDATGEIANSISAGANIARVQAGASIDSAISAGMDILLVKARIDITGSIDADRDIITVIADRDIDNEIAAGRDIEVVSAGTEGPWEFNQSTGESEQLTGILGSISGSSESGRDTYTIIATGDISATVDAGGGIATVDAGGSVSGDITAGDSVGYVGPLEQDSDEEPDDETRVSGSGVIAGVNVTGNIDAGGDITVVEAGQDIDSAMSAGRDVNSVTAGRDVAGSVDAGRDVDDVAAGTEPESIYNSDTDEWEESGGVEGDVSSDISAGRDADTISATHDVSGDITAGDYIRSVTAGNDVSGNLDAGIDVDSVVAGQDVLGSVAAGQDVVSIEAERDVDSEISAGRDVLSIVVGRDIKGSIDAGRDVTTLDVPRDMNSDVTAGRDIGDVSAGRFLEGALSAEEDVGNVTSGYVDGGHMSGDISAGGDIGNVIAYGEGGKYGDTSTPDVEAGGLDKNLWTVNATEDSYAHDKLPDVVPNRPYFPVGGDIGTQSSGTGIDAGGKIGKVTAFGEITADITAGGTIDGGGQVWAAETISGDISAGEGTLTVRSWGAIEGDVSTAEVLRVWGYGNVSGDLSSSNSNLMAGSWDSLKGSASAKSYVDLRAMNDVGPSVTVSISTNSPPPSPNDEKAKSTDDYVQIWAGKVVTLTAEAAEHVAVYAKEAVKAFTLSSSGATQAVRKFLSKKSDVWIEAKEKDLTANEIEAKDLVQLTAGGNIGKEDEQSYLKSTDGSISADAGKGIFIQDATAKKNIWVSARGENAKVNLNADGWVYVWAKDDIVGTIRSTKKASITSFGSIDGSLESTEDGIDVYTAKNAAGTISGKKWVDVETAGNLVSSITAGDISTPSNVYVRVGGNVTSPSIAAGGSVEMNVTGNVFNTAINANNGDLELTVNGDVYSDPRTIVVSEDATIWVGGSFLQQVTAADVQLTTGLTASGNITATKRDILIRAGDNVAVIAKAKGAVVVESSKSVIGQYEGGPGVSVVADGYISGSYIGDWIVDLRSANGDTTNANATTRKSRDEWLTSTESPFVKRKNNIQAERNALIGVGQGNSNRAKEIADELELATAEPSVNLDKIDVAVVADLVAANLAYDSSTTEKYGYIVVIDAIGNNLDIKILEPWCYSVSAGGLVKDESRAGVNRRDNKGGYGSNFYVDNLVTYYRIAKQYRADTGNADVVERVVYNRQPEKAKGWLDRWLQFGSIDRDTSIINFGVHLVPLVSALENYEKGNYFEAVLDVAGDIATLTGVGAVGLGAKCVLAGRRLERTVKLATTLSMGIDGSLAAISAARGFNAIFSEDPTEQQKKWGYFGDATLRLLGLSMNAIAFLRKRECFVAGTQIHTETGLRAIESLSIGDRIFAFDPRSESWVLSEVSLTFRRTAIRLVDLTLGNGETLTATPEHPFWVIEGEDLLTRPDPSHGWGEDWSTIPGRWVNLGDLQRDDVLLTRSGKTARVVCHSLRDGTNYVYNIEIQDLHNYAVGHLGVLTHNYGGSNLDDAANTGLPRPVETPHANAGGPSVRTPEVSVPDLTNKAKSALPPSARVTKPGKNLSATAINLEKKLAELSEKYGHEVIESITKDIAGNPAAIQQTIGQFETIISRLKLRNWNDIPKARRLESDDQIKNALQRVFVRNMRQEDGVLRNINRQELIRDLAEISDLTGFQKVLRNLKSNNPKIRGNLAEILAPAADRRAGKNVTEIVTDIFENGKKQTDVDAVIDGVIQQIKVGGNSKGTKDATHTKAWIDAIVTYVLPRTNSTKIVFRLDAESRVWMSSDRMTKALNELRAKYLGKCTIEFDPVNLVIPYLP